MARPSLASLVFAIVLSGSLAQRDDNGFNGNSVDVNGDVSIAQLARLLNSLPDTATAPQGTCKVLQGCADQTTKMVQMNQNLLSLLQTYQLHEDVLDDLEDRARGFDDFDDIIRRNFTRFEIEIDDDLDDIRRNMSDDRREFLEDILELRNGLNTLRQVADFSGTQSQSTLSAIKSSIEEARKEILTQQLDSAKQDSKVKMLEIALNTQKENTRPQFSRMKQCVWMPASSVDNGAIRECVFNKKDANSDLSMAFYGVLRVMSPRNQAASEVGKDACRRWYFTVNGQECSNPATVDTIIYSDDVGDNHHRSTPIVGICKGIGAGQMRVVLNVGPCKEYPMIEADAYTGWQATSRIILEEIDLDD